MGLVATLLIAITAAPSHAAATSGRWSTGPVSTGQVGAGPGAPLPPWPLAARAIPGEPLAAASPAARVPAPPPVPAAAAVAAPEPAAGAPAASGGPEAGVPPQAGITAEAWLVADASSGAILAARNPDLPDLPASTMKILTALVVLPGLPPDRQVAISDEAARVDGTRVGLVPGVRYTVRDLATAMLIASGNDATVALVEAAGGRRAVLDRMNRLAAELGAHDTVAGDPTGLDSPGQHTTAHDLAVIGRAALNQPVVRGYLTIPRASLPGRGDERFAIANHNALMGTYDGTIGIKNGYTVAAGATFVGAATRNGRTLIVSLLRTVPAYAADARALLDWGFAHAADVRPTGRLADPAEPGSAAAAAGGQGLSGDTGAGSTGAAGTAGGSAGDPAGASDSSDGSHGQTGPAEASRAESIGTVTWLALAVTIAATVLTLAGRARRRAPRRGARHATRTATRPARGRSRGPGPSWEPAPPPGHLPGHRRQPGHSSNHSRSSARDHDRDYGVRHGDSHRLGDVHATRQRTARAAAGGQPRRARPDASTGPREAVPRTRARQGPHRPPEGPRHLVGLPSLRPEPQQGDAEGENRRDLETPPYGTVRSPAP
ncbi:D-alanyl-D-alanine carboxypeptidase family protein [Parafrankia sp. FMc2]|uniref:D-alanyl-D-alanine carboxypeptidase family protein n=1 Tax=Parafrankia sp. FMc2 TaxID=3233196 RepID=UPI0034D79AF4